MLPLTNSVIKDAAAKMQAAFSSGDENTIKQAWELFGTAISDTIKADYETSSSDERALAQRGYRILTAEENKFYSAICEASKDVNPKQKFTDLLTGDNVDAMPTTIIEDVYKNLVNQHPLLEAISFTSVSYMTKWLLNDHTTSAAVWGKINSKITEEINSSFKMIELEQCKLSCFAVLPLDMLDLGPRFLDAYIRTLLTESIAVALEKAIITGTGKDMPIGLDRNISAGASVIDGVYPKKEAIKVQDFTPKSWGVLVAKLAKTEKGRYRKIEKVGLAVNPVDYFSKVMPATTLLTPNGGYAYNIFPTPTDVYQSAELDEGTAILFIPEEYFMALGASKNGNIQYDDSVGFLDDTRTWKIKTYANGRAFDNTVALVLDISELEALYVTVLNKSDVPTV